MVVVLVVGMGDEDSLKKEGDKEREIGKTV